MDPWAANTSSTLPTLSAEQQHVVDATVQARTNHLESLLSQLTNEVRALKTSNPPQPKPTSQSKSGKHPSGKGKATTVNHSSQPVRSNNTNKSAPAPPKDSSHATPKRAARAASAPPGVQKPKSQKSAAKNKPRVEAIKRSSPKRHPQQMQTSDFPQEFKTTKNALFVHIKILWGLLRQDSVPSAPELRTLQEFYNRFTNGEEVEKAAQGNSSPPLINSNEVELFKEARAGSIKFGRSVIHVGSNNICYAQGLMVRLGLRVWCPNLEEDTASLYNAAHRIAAITTFQELVAGKAYTYMNVNPMMATNSSLLIQAYNHFLRDARKEFAILNRFPQRYIDVLSQIGAHSDDEFDEKKGFSKIKTLPYRSKNASKFMRALDIVMKKAAEQDPSSSRKHRICKLPKQPVLSSYTTAPKGLPIDFYDPSWYHQLVPAQQKTIPNTQAVAFLPDASQSLGPKKQRNPDEKLKDSSFTHKYWEIMVEPYGLLGEDSSDEDSDVEEERQVQGTRNAANDSDDDEGHDLGATSPDESPDEFLRKEMLGIYTMTTLW
ncbi:hypothetical protein PGT21_032751 [Puccinia graminis f. sp. tritici]|uniref:Uncharacterized protein n=1 Tax=Puccinia graminis f. sp. tritici TaxID=56615 RepID=A0A5B0LQ82_PUCGR|nr:hypothetical protein PGT21_032751 [Puccinia graminis f. sp. tritici]